MSSVIPILDLGSPINCHDDWVNMSKTLSDLLTSEGYVYLINHGIPAQTISSAFKKTKEFFDLPYETKLKYLKPPEVVTYHGYNAKFTKDGRSNSDVLLREYFHAWDNQNNPSRIYPEDVQGMEDSILTLLYGRPMMTLNRILLKLLSGIISDEDGPNYWKLDSIHQGFSPNSAIGNYSYFSSMFYPRIPDEAQIEDDRRSARCTAHTDCSTYTLLFLDKIEGLQRKDASGQWHDIPLLEDGILFITGDFLEAVSGGKIPALVHRVPTDGRREERQSLPVYVLPDNETQFTPVNCTESTTFGDYYEQLIRNRYFR